MNLESLGATPAVYGAFEGYAAQGLVLARVAFSQRDQYRLFSAGGELFAEPSGALWYRMNRLSMPIVGDWVAARVAGDQAIVEAVLPRSTFFSRRAAGRCEEEQPIAANIDTVFLVCGLDGDFNLRRLERYLALAAESGASPVVVLQKADLCDNLAERMTQTKAVAGRAPVIACSARTPGGLDSAMAFLAPGRTVALLGSSGVGKSTMVNRIVGEERLRTQDVRAGDGRGRHTTTYRELIPLDSGGALIDTPGMRELQLWASQESIDQTFEELTSVAAMCRYRDCSHSGEPGCAVDRAMADGTISRERWESYRKLTGELQRHDRLAAMDRKRKGKELARALKQYHRLRKDR